MYTLNVPILTLGTLERCMEKMWESTPKYYQTLRLGVGVFSESKIVAENSL